MSRLSSARPCVVVSSCHSGGEAAQKGTPSPRPPPPIISLGLKPGRLICPPPQPPSFFFTTHVTPWAPSTASCPVSPAVCHQRSLCRPSVSVEPSLASVLFIFVNIAASEGSPPARLGSAGSWFLRYLSLWPASLFSLCGHHGGCWLPESKDGL